jgi:hypothetical protein
LGRVRAAISDVTFWSGESSTSNAVNPTAITVPSASAMPDRRISSPSKVARPKPRPMIGPINGEISIAPITTAGDDSSRPSTAMPADINTMKT